MNPLGRSLVRRAIQTLDGVRWLERLETMPFNDEGFGFDRFGLERESFWAGYLVVRQLYRRWFRVRSTGHENVPREGRVILAPNHSGLLPFDGAMITCDLLERLDPPRSVRSIVDHFAFALPYVGVFMQRTGQVPGTTRNFADLLKQEELVLVFPEGTRGIVKPFRERYQLRKFNVGFIELAIEHEAPIVPVAVVGAEEQAPILFGSKALGKKVGMPIFPVTPTFPLLGPLGLIPYPSQYHIAYGEPLWLHRDYPREAAKDPVVLQALAQKVQQRVQQMIDLGLEVRRGNTGEREWARALRATGATGAPTAPVGPNGAGAPAAVPASSPGDGAAL